MTSYQNKYCMIVTKGFEFTSLVNKSMSKTRKSAGEGNKASSSSIGSDGHPLIVSD